MEEPFVQDFSRVYEMLNYVDRQEGPFDYGDPKTCLFGIGRRSVGFFARLWHLRPFGNGGDNSYGQYLGLTYEQHWSLYTSLGFVARELGWKDSMNALDRHSCVMMAKFVLAKWENNPVKAWLYTISNEPYVEEEQGETIDA